MAAKGIQYVPQRYPVDAPPWFKEWMSGFIRDVLSKMDARNIIGNGISVTGETDEPATLSADADLAALSAATFVVMALTGDLANERKLTTTTQIVVNDGGAGGDVTLTLALRAVNPNNMADFPALSALVRRNNTDGSPNPVAAALDGEVLRRGSDLVEFGAVDLASPNAVTGVLPDANIAGTIARDSDVTTEIAAAITAHEALSDPHPTYTTAAELATALAGLLAAPVFTGPARLNAYTVGTLPAGTVGDTAYVTDATAPTYLGALTGGGAVVCPVFRNATIWVSG